MCSYLGRFVSLLVLFTSTLNVYADHKFAQFESRNINSRSVEFVLVGQAKRELFFFDIYEVGNYLTREEVQSLSDAGSPMLPTESGVPRMIRMHYYRDLGVERIKSVLTKNFKQNAESSEWAGLQIELQGLLGKLNQDIEEGDVLELIWGPNHTLQVSLKGQVFTSEKTPEFLKTLWSIWLGKNAVVDQQDFFQFRNLVK